MKNSGYVIRGELKGKKIPQLIEVAGHINSTPQKVKEALFQIIENHFPNVHTTVLYDLCAGSGQIGIEAISRSFLFSIFCEIDPQRFSRLIRWLEDNDLLSTSNVIRMDAVRAVRLALTQYPYGLESPLQENCRSLVLFVDPPYSIYEQYTTFAENLVRTMEKAFQKSFYHEVLLCLQAPSKVKDISSFFDRNYEYGKNQILVKKITK